MGLQRVVELTLMHMEPFSVFTKITHTKGRWECEIKCEFKTRDRDVALWQRSDYTEQLPACCRDSAEIDSCCTPGA